MIGKKVQFALEIDRDRICAVQADVQRHRVAVRAWCCADRPDEIDPSNAEAVGGWVARELARSGMPRRGAVIVVQRAEVVLKRFILTVDEQWRDEDLVSMVRLQISRQIPVPMEGTAVDFVQLPQSVSPTAPGADEQQGRVVRVLAGALPGDRLNWIRETAKRGGLGVSRIGLRASGAAAVFAETSIAHDGPILGVAPGAASTECVIVENGRLLFARAVDLPLPDDADMLADYAQQVAVEAKRTWMAYRANPDSSEVHAVSVLGHGPVAHDIGRVCAAELEMPYERLRLSAAIEFPPEMTDWERSVALPLIGLMAESVFTETTLDFLHPRHAPDRAATRRQRALLGVLAAVLVFGSFGAFGWLRLGDLEDRQQNLEDTLGRARVSHAKFVVESARLSHLERWIQPSVDWVAHLAWLSDHLPSTQEARLDGFGGVMDGEVVFTLPRGVRDITSGRWSSSQSVEISLGGPAVSRDIADQFRERLLGSNVYRVDTRGADVADSFQLLLHTSLGSPADATVPADDPDAGPEGEG